MVTYEEDVLHPLHFVEHDEEEREEEVGEAEEHEQVVFVHWLAERVAHTERDACHDHLEH